MKILFSPQDTLMCALAYIMTSPDPAPTPWSMLIRAVATTLFIANCIAIKYRFWG